MLRIALIIIFLSIFSHANKDIIDNSFITKFEYGHMLYKNPRGIGCNKCHADDAKGSFIALYKDRKGNVQKVNTPDITNITKEEFYKVLQSTKSKSMIMPTYFLTNDELDSIFFYIKNLKER